MCGQGRRHVFFYGVATISSRREAPKNFFWPPHLFCWPPQVGVANNKYGMAINPCIELQLGLQGGSNKVRPFCIFNVFVFFH